MKLNLPRESYIPKTNTVVVRAKNANAVVYASPEGAGKLSALGFFGNANKPSFHYTFRTEARRAQYVAEFFANCARIEASRAARKAERKTFVHSLKVGDILSNSWGYDQTNREFFEIIELVGSTMCVIRELACQCEQTGFMTEDVVPMPGKFTKAEPMRKRILQGNSVDIHNADFGRATLFHRPVAGKVSIMAPQYVSHTH